MATADEKFPRIRDDKFNVAGMFHIPLVQNGRLDRVIGDLYGTPTMYKAFAAANDIRNPMQLRAYKLNDILCKQPEQSFGPP